MPKESCEGGRSLTNLSLTWYNVQANEITEKGFTTSMFKSFSLFIFYNLALLIRPTDLDPKYVIFIAFTKAKTEWSSMCMLQGYWKTIWTNFAIRWTRLNCSEKSGQEFLCIPIYWNCITLWYERHQKGQRLAKPTVDLSQCVAKGAVTISEYENICSKDSNIS